MKEQKHFIYCFGIITSLSSVFCIFLECEWDQYFRYFISSLANCFTGHRSFIINLLIGAGTGGFLAFFTALINYISEREKFITEFCEMCEDFCTALHRLQYLYFEADVHLWAKYYNESMRNKKFPANKNYSVPRTANDDLVDWYKSKFPGSDSELLLEYRKEEIDKNLSLVAKSYYEFSGFNFCALDRVVKRSSFIRRNSNQQNRIKEIYTYIKENSENITSIIEYMQDFNASNNMVIQIDKLQSIIFGDVQYLGTTVFLPPTNKMEEHIKDLLKELNNTRR